VSATGERCAGQLAGRLASLALLGSAALAGCEGGESAQSPSVAPNTPPACDGSCAGPGTFLSGAEVETVIARGVAEAQARGARATIAVVDRAGNVLGVFAMNGAASTVTVRSTSGAQRIEGGLENVEIVPAAMAAISKAVTGAYLSSEGNAFSARTASQIVQSHFNPGEALAPGGPLSGVQFSQLPCSDLASRFAGGAPGAGPKRSPLGLSADPGGFPLYEGGTPIGGVGVVADGLYGLDANVLDRDEDLDEAIALAATFGLAAPDDRRADRITADGKTLRFSDVELRDLVSNAQSPPSFASLNGFAGALTTVPGYFAGAIQPGTAFGQPASGVRADALDYPGLDAFVLVDDANVERFRPRAGTEASGALTEAEAREILSAALRIANRARAQIRRPLGTPARVSIALVDSNGAVLGIVRSRDAPVFGLDVSLQKARAAALFSSAAAAAVLASLPDATYLDRGLAVLRREPPARHVGALRTFLGLPAALGDGQIAFTSRAIGNLARPFYPDGVDGNPHGPLAERTGQWSPFATGLQLDLVHNAIVQHVAFVSGLAPDVAASCTGVSGFDAGFVLAGAAPQIANGIQIFPGSVPIYRDRQLVGALGVSGDGVDQDDMIAFLGVHEAGQPLSGFGNAPPDLRSDRLVPQGTRLRYVSCPQSPFLDSNTQEPCSGL
jgi:uncharacterized protein GlcG (DUF336 family)